MDLRWRAVFLYHTLLPASFRKVGLLLGMAHVTVKNVVERHAATGSVESRQGAREAPPANQIFSYDEKWRLLGMMLESNDDDMFIEVQQRYFHATGVFPSLSTFTRAVSSLVMSRKRVRAARARARGCLATRQPSPERIVSLPSQATPPAVRRCPSTLPQPTPLDPPTRLPTGTPDPTVWQLSLLAKERDAVSAAEFRLWILQTYSLDQLVWIDETHLDNRLRNRRYGIAIRGIAAISKGGIRRGGDRYSALGAFCSTYGYLTHVAVSGGINGERFWEALTGSVFPCMRPFPAECSVLVMDNCSTHKQHRILQMAAGLGVIVECMPPYCPDVAAH